MTSAQSYQPPEFILQQHNRELALLNRVSCELNAILDSEKLIAHLLQQVAETLNAEAALLWMWADEPPAPRALVCRGFWQRAQGHTMPPPLTLTAGQGVAGWVALQGQSLALPHAPEDPRFFPGLDTATGLHTRSLLAAPLRGREGVIGVLEIVNKQQGNFGQDIALTETLAASAVIALENAFLVEELRQRTAELQARNEDLDAFAHAAAHDLQNPLGRVVGFAEVLQQTFATLPPADVQHYLELIARNGRRMSQIIDALLLLSLVAHEDIQKTPLDMASIVSETLENLHEEIQQTQATLVVPPSWPSALGYAPWVEAVWSNYLSNALKYGGRPAEGCAPYVELGFTLPADSPRPAAPEDARPTPEATIRFWVRDNGMGLRATEKRRLFKAFERLSRSHEKGHGLGLSIVLRIVTKLGGEVGVEGEYGQGSCFWFTLPAAPALTETL